MPNMVLEATDISKLYEMESVTVSALSKFSFGLREGHFAALVGPSGSGKSSALHIMGLLDRPTSGQVLFKGRNTDDLSEAEITKIRATELGFIFQSFNLLPSLTAGENVELQLRFAGAINRKARAKEAIAKVGMDHRMNHLPSQLSGGERQRIAIARAIAKNPAVLLADEPTGNLDNQNSQQIGALLNELNREGLSILLVTHDLELAHQAQSVWKMKDGKLDQNQANRTS